MARNLRPHHSYLRSSPSPQPPGLHNPSLKTRTKTPSHHSFKCKTQYKRIPQIHSKMLSPPNPIPGSPKTSSHIVPHLLLRPAPHLPPISQNTKPSHHAPLTQTHPRVPPSRHPSSTVPSPPTPPLPNVPHSPSVVPPTRSEPNPTGHRLPETPSAHPCAPSPSFHPPYLHRRLPLLYRYATRFPSRAHHVSTRGR